MLSDITIGQYFPGHSIIHRLDPRTKIIGTLSFIMSIFFADNYTGYALLGIFAVTVIAVAQIPLRLMVKTVKPLWIIIVLTLGIHLFSTPGMVIYSIASLTATAEGLRMGVLMTARLVFLIVISSLLTFTTSPITLTDGIEHLLKPFQRLGVPAHELAMMMTIALRFIPTLLEEADRIIKAQTSRGADFTSGHLLNRAKNMVPLLVPLFVSAFRRADELATAMEARCYRGGQNRTRMKELRIETRDFMAYGTLVILLGCLEAAKWAPW